MDVDVMFGRLHTARECSLFFFLQAEDGIRDHCVTGVQTCALPIYRVALARYGSGVPGYTAGRPGQQICTARDSGANRLYYCSSRFGFTLLRPGPLADSTGELLLHTLARVCTTSARYL